MMELKMPYGHKCAYRIQAGSNHLFYGEVETNAQISASFERYKIQLLLQISEFCQSVLEEIEESS